MTKERLFTEQELFWAREYSDDYIKKNSKFDHELGIKAWGKCCLE